MLIKERYYLAELLLPGLKDREAVYLLDRVRWRAAIERRDKEIEALAARIFSAMPDSEITEPTLDVYHDLKQAWFDDDELICYRFPAIVICRHRGQQYYLRESYSPQMALLVWDKLNIFIPSPERRPDYYEARNVAS